MNSITFGYDTGASPTATIYNRGTGDSTSIAVAETPSESGRFLVDFTDVAAATYDLIVVDGGFTIYAESWVWDGTNITNAALAAIQAKTNLISAGGITARGPFAQDGSVLEIIAGDDYLTADNRALPFTLPDADITGCTITLVITPATADAGDGFTATGIVVDGQHAAVELTREQSATLTAGTENYSYRLIATTSGGHVLTQVIGYFTVVDSLQPVPQ